MKKHADTFSMTASMVKSMTIIRSRQTKAAARRQDRSSACGQDRSGDG